jgi:hypothetical protein
LNVILDLIAAKNIECPQGLPGAELLFQVPQLRKDVQRIKDDQDKIVGKTIASLLLICRNVLMILLVHQLDI